MSETRKRVVAEDSAVRCQVCHHLCRDHAGEIGFGFADGHCTIAGCECWNVQWPDGVGPNRPRYSPAATPPTPDRAEVRDALVGVFTHFPYTPELMLAAHRLVHALGIPVDSEAERIADALLGPAPLPADVQAVVEKIQPIAEYEDGIELAYMDTEDAATFAADLRTLLAHLTRAAQ